jgi:hypothetical protein
MAKYEKGSFITLPNKQVLRGKKPATQAVYLWICEHANEYGICFPAIKTLGVESGSSESTVKRAISELEKSGILQKVQRKNTSNEYQILIVENEEGGFSVNLGGVTENPGVGSDRPTNSIQLELNPHNSSSEAALRAMTPSELAQEFFKSSVAQEALIDKLVKVGVMKAAAEDEIKKFIDYWTELNGTGKRQRWQMQKTFELRKRMATWLSRANIRKTNHQTGRSRVWA